jgi:integrase
MGPLSTMAMSMLLHRLDATITVHGFRSLFRDWAAEIGVEVSVAEQCLAHAIGRNVTRSYLRTSMLELRRPVLASWGIRLRRDRRQRDRASQGRGVMVRIAITAEALNAHGR